MEQYTYNLVVWALIFFAVNSVFFSLAKQIRHSSNMLGDIVFVFGFLASFFVVYFIGIRPINSIQNDLYEKLNFPAYQLCIVPKNYPFQKMQEITLKNKDTHMEISIKIESRLNSSEIYEKIKQHKPAIDELLVEK